MTLINFNNSGNVCPHYLLPWFYHTFRYLVFPYCIQLDWRWWTAIDMEACKYIYKAIAYIFEWASDTHTKKNYWKTNWVNWNWCYSKNQSPLNECSCGFVKILRKFNYGGDGQPDVCENNWIIFYNNLHAQASINRVYFIYCMHQLV